MTHQLLSLFLLVLALILCPSATSAEEYDEFETYDGEEEFEQKDEEEEDFETQKPTTKSSDEEEFVGSQKKADSTPKTTPMPPQRPAKWTDFGLEAIYVVLILIYGVLYFVGSRQNDQLAALWGRTFKDLFDSNFAKVGADAMILKDTPNVFVMRATGRINCVGLQAVLELRKRHDFFFTLYQTFAKTRDRVTIDVALDKMDPFIFAIVNNKDIKSYKANNKDVQLFTKARKSEDETFPDDRFTILSENEELVPYLLPGPVVGTLDSFADFIEVIHFSDQYPNKVYKKILHFVFYVPTSQQDMESLRTLINMVMYFIDHVSAINLSADVKKKAAERRTQANAELEKEKAEERQELLRKKQEEKKKKDEERFKKMTPDQLAKEEAKQRRRDLKRSSKVKVVFA